MRGRRWAVAGLLAVLMAGFAGGLSAQQQPVRLTLEQAVARGLAEGEEVKAARARRDLAEGQVIQARSGALPQVSAQLGYTRTIRSLFDDLRMIPSGGDGEDGSEGENPFASLPFGQRNAWVAGVTIAQPLYAGGKVGAAVGIARDVRLAADLDVEEVEADLTLQIRTAYFQAVLANELVKIAEEAYKLASDQLAQVELFHRQGTASEFDVLRARVERDNLEPNIVEAKNALRVAELNLKRLINLPAEQPLELVTPLDPVIADVDRQALEEGMTRRPALAALDALVSAREGAIKVAKGDRLPTITAVGSFAQQAFPRRGVPFDTDWRHDWTVGIQASIPVFDGLRTAGQIDQAEAELRQAQLQRAQLQEALKLELEAALGEFEAARAQIEARRATVAQARRALELAELRFQSGLATQLELSNARLMLEQARVNEAQSLFNYVSALARLERVSGGVVPLVAPRLPAGG